MSRRVISSTARNERRGLALATLVACALHAGLAGASPESEGLFDEGKRLLDANRVAEACKAFERSFDLAPLGGTLLAMAICHEKEGRIATALAEYERAAEVARTSARDDRLAHADRAIVALRPRVPYLVVEVPPGAPSDLAARLDGRALDAKELSRRIAVDPGSHRVEWNGTGIASASRVVMVKEATTERVVLEAQGLEEADPVEEEWDGQTTAALVVGATGVLAIGAGGVLGALALGKKSESDEACQAGDAPVRCTASGLDAYEDAQGLALGADVAFISGVALVGAAVAIYLWPVDEELARRSVPRVRGVASAAGAFIHLEGALP